MLGVTTPCHNRCPRHQESRLGSLQRQSTENENGLRGSHRWDFCADVQPFLSTQRGDRISYAVNGTSAPAGV